MGAHGSAPPTVTQLFGSLMDTEESENSVILLESSCKTTTALWSSTGLTFNKTKDLWRSVQHYANKALERWHGVVIFHNGIWVKTSVFSPHTFSYLLWRFKHKSCSFDSICGTEKNCVQTYKYISKYYNYKISSLCSDINCWYKPDSFLIVRFKD